MTDPTRPTDPSRVPDQVRGEDERPVTARAGTGGEPDPLEEAYIEMRWLMTDPHALAIQLERLLARQVCPHCHEPLRRPLRPEEQGDRSQD
jgi:hypothetical protein